MNKRFGFSATYGFSSIVDAIEFASKNGFATVEINLNMPEFFPERYDKQEREHIKKFAKYNNISLTFHGPEDINLCSMQRLVAETGVTRLKECIDFASELGGERFTFHIGDSVKFTMVDGSIYVEDYYKDKFEVLLNNSFKEVVDYAKDKIIICAENTGYFSSVKRYAIKQLLGKGLYLTWDMGHSFLKKEQQEFMIENCEYVRNVHIHDVKGKKDHSIIGEGDVDFKHFMSFVEKNDAYYIIEVRPKEAALESYKNIKEIFKE